jgi:hypothetical protein
MRPSDPTAAANAARQFGATTSLVFPLAGEAARDREQDYAGANRHGHLRCRLRSRIGAKGG